MTCRQLDKAGLTYRVVDVASDPTARSYVTEELGYTEAPVVIVDQDEAHHWSGFRPDRIKAVAARATTNTTIASNGGATDE
ncbi:glutaredoxin-like protein NrdH [Georgenia satyanarayanai]|uniref:Glutaredoxin-like protein NrdH n=1 Tax=Georgenia satyanarayanai TaxID=860221 RepID=A0A2Y9AS77_9MICO|nr:glutaredoxin-like protein NrdH [Georgenia satyanarayanai]SSA46936.1 glutaredoxin-like protein NrdH [Georgenia satyanarayanai]